jgi:hypothetical protein
MISRSNGDTFIQHREYIGEVAGSTNFAPNQYPMNPGISTTFPWLSGVAQRFDKYRFRKLDFKYETQTSTATVGTVMLVPDYNAADPAPANKAVALAYEDSARGEAWTKFSSTMARENLNALPQYNIRVGPLPANLDIKTYDVGNMWLCLSGEAGNAVIGELWVEYEVELIAPSLGSSTYAVPGQAQALISSVAPTTAAIYGTPASTGSTLVTVAGNVLTFLTPGLYLVDYFLNGTLAVGVSNVVSAGAAFDTKYFNSVGYAQTINNATSWSQSSIIYVTQASATLTTAITITAGSYMNCFVSSLPSSLI